MRVQLCITFDEFTLEDVYIDNFPIKLSKGDRVDTYDIGKMLLREGYQDVLVDYDSKKWTRGPLHSHDMKYLKRMLKHESSHNKEVQDVVFRIDYKTREVTMRVWIEDVF